MDIESTADNALTKAQMRREMITSVREGAALMGDDISAVDDATIRGWVMFAQAYAMRGGVPHKTLATLTAYHALLPAIRKEVEDDDG